MKTIRKWQDVSRSEPGWANFPALMQREIDELREQLAKPESEPSDREAWVAELRSAFIDVTLHATKANKIADMLEADAAELADAERSIDDLKAMIFRLAGAQQVACSTLPERDALKPAEKQGLFRKFSVERFDRSDQPGGKHHGCDYFVLDVTCDPYTPAALRAYAEACAVTHPQLSADLKSRWGTQQVAVPQDPPYSNCRFKICDLPGQCKGEGKCHHPAVPAYVPLTDDDIDRLWRKTLVEHQQAICRVTRVGKWFARAIEQACERQDMKLDEIIRTAIERHMADFPANCKNAAVEVAHAVLAHKGEVK